MASELDKLIDQILSGLRAGARQRGAPGGEQNGAPHEAPAGGRIYRDEPILRPASALPNALPAELVQLQKYMRSYELYGQPAEVRFYREGKRMEAYEEDFEFHDRVVRYFPTYETLEPRQLRGYFGWRTRARHGHIEPQPQTFLYLYAYELINQIGVSTPQEGFEKLHALWQAGRAGEPGIDRYLRGWLVDYAVYYGLDPQCADELADAGFDRAVLALRDWRTCGDEALFSAAARLSAYRIETSRYYRDYPERTRRAVCRTLTAFSAYCEKNRRHPLCEKLFGQPSAAWYTPFSSAVFCDRLSPRSYEYSFDEAHTYRCTGSRWSCTLYQGSHARSSELGALLRCIDCTLREKTGYRHPLQPGEVTALAAGIVHKEIDRLLAEEAMQARAEQARRDAEAQAQARAAVAIDLGRLAAIRRAADETCGRLLVPDGDAEPAGTPVFPAVSDRDAPNPAAGPEPEPAAVFAAEPAAGTETAAVFAAEPAAGTETAAAVFAPAGSGASDTRTGAPAARTGYGAPAGSDFPAASDISDTPAASPLGADETAFLRAVLGGGDWRAAARAAHATPGLLGDAVNEKLFDRFGDTVLEFDGDTPVPVEDYLEELKGIVLP